LAQSLFRQKEDKVRLNEVGFRSNQVEFQSNETGFRLNEAGVRKAACRFRPAKIECREIARESASRQGWLASSPPAGESARRLRVGLLVVVGHGGHRGEALRGRLLELRGRAGRGMVRAVEEDAEARLDRSAMRAPEE
jgi:hypothetical protein